MLTENYSKKRRETISPELRNLILENYNFTVKLFTTHKLAQTLLKFVLLKKNKLNTLYNVVRDSAS